MTTAEFIPFSPGRRPTDEARHPGMGSSDPVAFRDGDCYLLLAVRDAAGCTLELKLSDTWAPVAPAIFAGDGTLSEHPIDADRTYVLVLNEFPGEFSFATLFSRRFDIELRLLRDGAPVAHAATTLDVCDVGLMGSLYQRIVDELVVPDTERQAPGLPHAYHPWFPVLLIGGHKAELYTRALVGDIVHKRRNLADPGWLVRVGLYLEFLTALGIIEGVDPGVLTPAEREAFETADAFEPIRRRINPGAWRRVWDGRAIALRGFPRAGPVAVQNLLVKRRATLQFLHLHHEDLEQAIALAGPNPHSAQETWHRVFRDAERAVLRQTPAAFPELAELPVEVRKFVLWHRQGKLGVRVPGPLPKLLGDQDGLFGSACNQYRDSMNQVAEWARGKGLMDYTGEEAIPRGVSLFEAHLFQPSRVALLQRRDGYDTDRIEVGAELPAGYEPPLRVLAGLLASTVPFTILRADEIAQLAGSARPLTFGPMERIIVQGQKGDSLYAVVEGTVEVYVRREDGTDVHLGERSNGTVFGEMSLLTGEPRSATVRAVDGALVYEVGLRQLEPIVAGRPELVEALREAMETRLRTQGRLLERYDSGGRGLFARLWRARSSRASGS